MTHLTSILQLQVFEIKPVMNKENAYKNISLMNCKQNKMPVRPVLAQMSFRNLNSKSFFKENREESRSPATTKRHKTNTNRAQNSVVHTEVSESVIGNQNNNLMEAFQLERQSLMNTVKLYKEQIQVLTQENAKMKREAAKTKSRTRQGEQILKQEFQKRIQLSKKVQEYENMLPKLLELEHMSQKIIEQNNTLKSKIKVQQALLNNVANLAKCEQIKTPALQKICTLTQAYLKANSVKKSAKQ